MKFLLCLTSVSSLLVNTFYPLVSKDTLELSSTDTVTLLESSFSRSGSDILNKIPAVSYSDWKNSNRGWIIIAGLEDYKGQFKTLEEDIIFNVYQESKDVGISEIFLKTTETVHEPLLGEYKTLASEISALKSLDPSSLNNYIIVVKGLQEIPRDSSEFKIGLELLEKELTRFKDVSENKPLLISTLSKWKSRTLLSRQVNSCAQSEAECMTLYNNCTRHGKCESRKLGKNKDCWVCTCISTKRTDDNGQFIPGYESPIKWAGTQCELEDISVPFQILFWTSVALILLLVMVIGMMMNADGGDSFTGNQFEHRLKEE